MQRASTNSSCTLLPPHAASEYTAAHFRTAASSSSALDLEEVRTIALPLTSRDIRLHLQQQLCPRLAEPPRVFNPSIIAAPDGLCPRCKYLVSLRVSNLHQCGATPPTPSTPAHNALFAANAILALDGEFRVVASNWLVNSLENQVVNGSFVGGQRVHDVRLFRFGTHVLATWHCHRCAFVLAKLHVAMRRDEHGHERLFVWSTVWDKFRFEDRRQRARGGVGLQGRNQALAAVILPEPSADSDENRPRADGGGGKEQAAPLSLLVQPWLDTMVVLGQPRLRRVRTPAFPFRSEAQRLWSISGIVPNWRFDPQRGVQHTFVNLTTLHVNVPRRRRVRDSHRARADAPRPAPTAGTAALPHASSSPLLSPTAHLVYISRRFLVSGRHRRCSALLGIAHYHRRERVPPFQWGSEYDHFFYTMAARPPFRMLAASRPFCLRAAGAMPQAVPRGCESVQFVSGLAPIEDVEGPTRERLALAYGVNDCEAKIGTVAMSEVWRRLEPLPGSRAACEPNL